jgi:hypothetical protein
MQKYALRQIESFFSSPSRGDTPGLRQTAAHRKTSQATLSGGTVRQPPKSALGAPKGPMRARKTRVHVRLFGERAIFADLIWRTPRFFRHLSRTNHSKSSRRWREHEA